MEIRIGRLLCPASRTFFRAVSMALALLNIENGYNVPSAAALGVAQPRSAGNSGTDIATLIRITPTRSVLTGCLP
jgi:hypothetical protein